MDDSPVTVEWTAAALRRLEDEIAPGAYRSSFADYNADHCARFAALLQAVERVSGRSGRVLDFGAFPGQAALLFRERGFDVTAVSQSMGEYAGAVGFEAFLRSHGIDVAYCDIEREYAPLASEGFDHVLFTEVLEHLWFHPFHALGEICRLLKPGGRVWLTTPNLASARYLLRLLRGRSIFPPLAGPWSGSFPTALVCRHVREYTAEDLRFLLAPGGRYAYRFESTNVAGRNWLGDTPGRLSPRGRKWTAAIERMFPRFGNALLAEAVKPAALRVMRPDELRAEGGWRERVNPLNAVQPPVPAGFPYPFRFLRGEATIEFQLPEGWPARERPVRALLPCIWMPTQPPLPAQTLLFEVEGVHGETSRVEVTPAADVQIVSVPLGVLSSASPRRIRLRVRSERLVIPDDVLRNGDRQPTGPGLAEAHWALEETE